jgi:hypothetical protein
MWVGDGGGGGMVVAVVGVVVVVCCCLLLLPSSSLLLSSSWLLLINKSAFESHMTTGFEQKYENDILIQKKVIKWSEYLNMLYTV